MFTLSTRSLNSLEGVHPDLVKVVKLAGEKCDAKGLDFIVTEGCRTLEQQRKYVAEGHSQTMHSRHLGGFAIDYVARTAGRVSYFLGAMKKIADCFKEAADELEVEIEWGGDWASFKDTPHIQLSHRRYPDGSWGSSA